MAETNTIMNYWQIDEKFRYAFKSAQTDEQQNEAVRVYIEQSIANGYMLPRRIQGPIKKTGPNGWGLRKKDMRVQSDPYSAYNWR
jgi:hypothetical protein